MVHIPEAHETKAEIEALIALSLVPGIGSTRNRILVNHFGSARNVFSASHDELARVAGVGVQTARAIRSFEDFERVSYQVECAEAVGARLVTYWSAEYPDVLRSIFDPPAFLWVRGSLGSLENPSLAIVGTRKPSLYGKRVTSFFAKELVGLGFTIVSGLAYGVDTVAHEATIDAKGSTIAVLGSGVDRIYPSVNKKLARRIMEKGAIISEFPMQAKPDAANFPRRNRIISGLTLGTLVTEAYEQGGALITARMAVEQNRDVFAVPGSIFNDSSRGVLSLLQQGYGKLVYKVQDIVEDLGVHWQGRLPAAEGRDNTTAEPLNHIENKLYEILTHEPMQINTICNKSGLDPSTVLVYLLSLEFKGLIFQMAGKQFYKV